MSIRTGLRERQAHLRGRPSGGAKSRTPCAGQNHGMDQAPTRVRNAAARRAGKRIGAGNKILLTVWMAHAEGQILAAGQYRTKIEPKIGRVAQRSGYWNISIERNTGKIGKVHGSGHAVAVLRQVPLQPENYGGTGG